MLAGRAQQRGARRQQTGTQAPSPLALCKRRHGFWGVQHSDRLCTGGQAGARVTPLLAKADNRGSAKPSCACAAHVQLDAPDVATCQSARACMQAAPAPAYQAAAARLLVCCACSPISEKPSDRPRPAEATFITSGADHFQAGRPSLRVPAGQCGAPAEGIRTLLASLVWAVSAGQCRKPGDMGGCAHEGRACQQGCGAGCPLSPAAILRMTRPCPVSRVMPAPSLRIKVKARPEQAPTSLQERTRESSIQSVRRWVGEGRRATPCNTAGGACGG